jgi:class 3 adenylate cyclase
MLIIIPIISDDFYTDESNSCYSMLAEFLSSFYAFGTPTNSLNATTIENLILTNLDTKYPILNITYKGDTVYALNDTQLYRKDEIKYTGSMTGDLAVVYTTYIETSTGAILSIVKTFYVCVLLAFIAIFIEKDAKELILEPLEVMVEIVEKVTKDPISAKNTQALEENTRELVLNNKQRKKEELKDKYEVKVVQSAIVKISALLAIGFGEAGGEIIKENLSNYQDLNPMLLGRRKTAIFGFCDIRKFPIINEALQEKTVVFVNEVADIVHSSVDRFGGAANKNIGDAFLMVWRIRDHDEIMALMDKKEKEKELNKQNSNVNNNNSMRRKTISNITYKMVKRQTLADLSVLGYLKVIIRINKDRRILAYQHDKDIKHLLPGYKVNMGFGLHIGWAIEGAIGSNCKIDASYLSPNVNMSARLEAATRQYGVTILISGELFDSLSQKMQRICRHIDTVEVKGSKTALRLYTIDVNLNLKPSKPKTRLTLNEKLLEYGRKKEMLLCEIEEYGNVSELILKRKSFKKLLRTKIPKAFYTTFDKGMDSYILGQWDKAKINFDKCLTIHEDNPTKVLLEYIGRYDNTAPEDWNGYRSLTSK